MKTLISEIYPVRFPQIILLSTISKYARLPKLKANGTSKNKNLIKNNEKQLKN
jgi:hypothetical protein